MSTPDQNGDRPLTRKQLREIRLTGATPVIGEEEAAAAKAAQQAPATPLPRPAQPADVPPAPAVDIDATSAPLTRRQARAQERIRTASVPVIEPASADAEDGEDSGDDVVSSVPVFAPVPAQKPETDAGEDADPADEAAEDAVADDTADQAGAADEVIEEAAAEQRSTDGAADTASEGTASEEVDAAEAASTDDEVADDRPVVSPSFGRQVLDEQVPVFAPSFDELIDSGGSHRAPNTLIFTHPGEGSLSGPVASTGELLITGSYELPRGLSTRGHADGTTDGKEIDSVLVDGELPPASSPTPIAASAAVSTSKPAGEVIRPPAPEKGNKLMLILTITAGGLAVLVAAALIVAFTTNVLG